MRLGGKWYGGEGKLDFASLLSLSKGKSDVALVYVAKEKQNQIESILDTTFSIWF